MNMDNLPLPITLVTGPRESGRTTYASLVFTHLRRRGYDYFHNGTLLFGGKSIVGYLGEPNGLLRLAHDAPANSPILIEEADVHRATRRTGDPIRDAAIVSALEELARKGCYLLLTTVQGQESEVAQVLVDSAWEHVTPHMDVAVRGIPSLATIHRLGRRLIPVATVEHDPESVRGAMLLADTFKETRQGWPDGVPTWYSQDKFVEVPQTSIDQMKHPKFPEYPVHYRRRIVRKLGDDGKSIHRLTQESRLDFLWLESVNEHPHETVVLEMLGRTLPQWGFEYEHVHVPQNDKFPDGRALINGESTNLEVVSIQPRYPAGHSLHDLVAKSQTGRVPEPKNGGILRCSKCRKPQAFPDATLENLPEHDENHEWVLYLPNLQAMEGIPKALTVTPLLTINQEGFTDELQGAVQSKSCKIADQGARHENWVIIIAQGFPVEPQWFSQLPDQWPANVDGIVVAATDGYLGATQDLVPHFDLTMVLLKCPENAAIHNCYHPSYLYRISRFDEEYQPISPNTHNAGEVSLAAFRDSWPPLPTKRILIVRDENENEIDRLEDTAITGQQASEVVKERNFAWRPHGHARTVLAHESDGDAAIIWAEVEMASDENANYWTATAYRKVVQLYQEIGEDFETQDEASQWCEVLIATTLLDEH